MKITTAKEVLEKNGIEVKLTSVMKDGRRKEALSIGSGKIVPTVYQDTLDPISDEAEMLLFAEQITARIPSFDIGSLFTKEYFLTHVRSCLRPATSDNESLTYPAFGDLEEYFRVFMNPFNDDSCPSVIVLRAHLDALEIDELELRQAARDNLREQVQILPMADVISALMGIEAPEMPVDDMLYVASTRDRLHGASIMLLGDVLTDFCKAQGLESVCIIPSSRHEILLVKGTIDRCEIDNMIREVNSTQVAEQDVLSDHGYWFTAA